MICDYLLMSVVRMIWHKFVRVFCNEAKIYDLLIKIMMLQKFMRIQIFEFFYVNHQSLSSGIFGVLVCVTSLLSISDLSIFDAAEKARLNMY